MKSRLGITTSRVAEIYAETLSVRRELYHDHDFFKMTEAWDELCGGNGQWSIKTYRTDQLEDYKRKAGVVVFGDRLTLTADERLMANAKQGCKLSNYILAHEMGHVILNHHAKGAVTKNFQLFSGPAGAANVPPTLEELEANYSAVFFQCGAALADARWDSIQLANRAFSDVYYVKKAQAIIRLEVFQRELRRPKPKYERVVL